MLNALFEICGNNLFHTSGVNWWLRSPHPSNANNEYNVNSSGGSNNNNANNSYGVAPDCLYSDSNRVSFSESADSHVKQGDY